MVARETAWGWAKWLKVAKRHKLPEIKERAPGDVVCGTGNTVNDSEKFSLAELWLWRMLTRLGAAVTTLHPNINSLWCLQQLIARCMSIYLSWKKSLRWLLGLGASTGLPLQGGSAAQARTPTVPGERHKPGSWHSLHPELPPHSQPLQEPPVPLLPRPRELSRNREQVGPITGAREKGSRACAQPPGSAWEQQSGRWAPGMLTSAERRAEPVLHGQAGYPRCLGRGGCLLGTCNPKSPGSGKAAWIWLVGVPVDKWLQRQLQTPAQPAGRYPWRRRRRCCWLGAPRLQGGAWPQVPPRFSR